jgi:hypothetical protein
MSVFTRYSKTLFVLCLLVTTGAFALAAQNFEAFEQALISKLVKETAALQVHKR